MGVESVCIVKDVKEYAKVVVFYLCLALRGWGHSGVKCYRLSDEEELSVQITRSSSYCQIQIAWHSVSEITQLSGI